MHSERLGNDEFLEQLNSLLSTTHSSAHGSVFLTQKPLPVDQATAPGQLLIRATNGSTLPKKSKVPAGKIAKKHSEKPRIKLSTVVEASEVDSFFTKYAEFCKKGMEGLRKRDKKKAKEKAKAKKKGKGQTG